MREVCADGDVTTLQPLVFLSVDDEPACYQSKFEGPQLAIIYLHAWKLGVESRHQVAGNLATTRTESPDGIAPTPNQRSLALFLAKAPPAGLTGKPFDAGLPRIAFR